MIGDWGSPQRGLWALVLDPCILDPIDRLGSRGRTYKYEFENAKIFVQK